MAVGVDSGRGGALGGQERSLRERLPGGRLGGVDCRDLDPVLARDTRGTAVSIGRFSPRCSTALTFAGLLFVVASGFTLVFGLMRTVNMAHGSLFLLAGFLAIGLQQAMVGKTRNIAPEDVSLLSWLVPLVAAAGLAALVGVVLQQVFLRWNQGQELRQALITLAISVVLADQMLRQFGGLAKSMVWPGAVTHFVEIGGNRYATSRLFMLAVAVVVGVALWLWLTRTRMGMIIRAGVDDERWCARWASTSPRCSP
jgi:branched-chain amino acid transport system permease protein